MSILKFFLGEKGENGKDGIDGLSGADVNSFDLDQPLLDSFVDNQLTKNAFISSTRTDNVSFIDRYGRNFWTKKESTTNFIPYSSDFSQWNDTFNRWSIIGNTSDPFGSNSATEINLDVDTDNLSGTGEVLEYTLSSLPNTVGCVSFYIKVISGEVSGLDFGRGSDVRTVDTPTGEYIRIVYPIYVSGSFIFSINPRGKSGARIALYGVQIEDTPTAKDLINTIGSPLTKSFEDNLIRQGGNGVLIEESKTNLVNYSNDLSNWTIENATALQSPIADAFGHTYQYTRVEWGSISNISLTTSTGSLTQGNSYTVSFWAYIAGGSIQPIIVSLGGGADVVFETPSVEGYARLSATCVAGGNDDLKIKLESQALNAELLLSSIQVEKGELTSYIQTGATDITRSADNFSMSYTYNFPAPNLNWTLIFGKSDLLESDSVKTIFSNGESGGNEFSLTYQNRLLTINMGGNTASADLYDYAKVALVFDGTQVKFYGEKELIATELITLSSFISSTVYIGYNGVDKFFNAYLSHFMAYNVDLTENEIIYLLGA